MILVYLFNGEIIKGDSVAVVEFLRSQVYDPDRFASLDDYMDYFARSLWKFRGVGVNVSGETLEARCGSLVSQLLAKNIIETVDC